VRPAVGDVNGDGRPDLVTAAGAGGGPRVAVWDGKAVTPGAAPRRLVNDFFAFEPGLRDGAYVAAGDVTGDGRADLVLGGGPTGAPRVRVLSGAASLGPGAFGSADQVPAARVADFFAGDPAARGGARVAVKDVDADGRADVVAGSGDDRPGRGVPGGHPGGQPGPGRPDQDPRPARRGGPGGVFVG
jgi:hypothetical protein